MCIASYILYRSSLAISVDDILSADLRPTVKQVRVPFVEPAGAAKPANSTHEVRAFDIPNLDTRDIFPATFSHCKQVSLDTMTKRTKSTCYPQPTSTPYRDTSTKARAPPERAVRTQGTLANNIFQRSA